MSEFNNKAYPMISSEHANEGFNAISHLVAALIALAGLVLLIVFSAIQQKWIHLISFSIYGATVFISMTMSSILHFFLWFKKFHKVFGILDHSAIYLLIAGTYTPFCLVIVRGGLGWTIFGIIWGLAALNIIIKSIYFTKVPLWFSMGGYLAMGWLSVALIHSVYSKLGFLAVFWILLGGLFYTIGAVIFITEKPNFFPGKFANHELWHVLVMLGNITFLGTMFSYVLPY
jgi:hemolysin III